jgi:hypothetical protein
VAASASAMDSPVAATAATATGASSGGGCSGALQEVHLTRGHGGPAAHNRQGFVAGEPRLFVRGKAEGFEASHEATKLRPGHSRRVGPAFGGALRRKAWRI